MDVSVEAADTSCFNCISNRSAINGSEEEEEKKEEV